MTKRKTKAQREAEQLAALQQRLDDIYLGACGREVDDDMWADAEDLSRIIPAVRCAFGTCRQIEFVYEPHVLNRWTHPERLAGYLFERGFRADEVWVEEENNG